MIIVSEHNPSVCIFLNTETLDHIARHFEAGIPGSKFYMQSPIELLNVIVNQFPREIESAKVNEDGFKIITISFPYEIGTCNIVPIEDLTEEEMASLHWVKRDNSFVRCAESKREFHTSDCQLILDSENNVVTVYPGILAPPLPTENHDDPFWDSHVFILP